MNAPLPPISDEDREHILRQTAELWPQLAGTRFFIAGGTGFYGKWLLESIAAANDAFETNVRATILSRTPARFALEMPHLASRPEFSWLTGDMADFAFPEGHFDYVFHFATASAAEVGAGDTALMIVTLAGTARLLQFARQSGARRLLLASSGAVYGRQPPELSHIPEYYTGAPDLSDPMSAYGEIKRMSELMCLATTDVECVIARGFAFLGPYLPLSGKFAAGSFIRDALAGGPIRVSGDGMAWRSYLHAADLVAWLMILLVRGRRGESYNVGSDQAISIRDVARAIAEAAGNINVEIAQEPAKSLSRYVPSIDKARHELGLEVRLPFAAAVARTIKWAKRP